MAKKSPEQIPESIKPQPEAEGGPAKVQKLSLADAQTIVDIVTNAPAPGGIPQADARAQLLARFKAWYDAS